MKFNEYLTEYHIHFKQKDVDALLKEDTSKYTKEVYRVFSNVLLTLKKFNIKLSKNQQADMVYSIAKEI